MPEGLLYRQPTHLYRTVTFKLTHYRFGTSLDSGASAGTHPVSGHEERFPPTRLSAGFGLRKETIAGMRRNGRDAPIPVVRMPTGERVKSTLNRPS